MSVTCPTITITAPMPPGGLECYRGYIIYRVGDIPASMPDYPSWASDPTYANWYGVYYNTPVYNVTGDKPFWSAQSTLALLKNRIDAVITAETGYKTNPEGNQC